MPRPRRFHLIVDIQPSGQPSIDRRLVESILLELPPLIDMQILSGPHVVDGVEHNPGISGFVIIDFSHISIHTFANYNQLMVDIFSCKEFSREIVIDYLSTRLQLEPGDIEPRLVSWG